MKLSDLSPQALDKFRSYGWDSLIEKHKSWLWYPWADSPDAELLELDSHLVLLLVFADHYPNISVLRCNRSVDGQSLTIFLKDMTVPLRNPEYASFCGGFLAVCNRVPGEDFYIAVVYHEWYIDDKAIQT